MELPPKKIINYNLNPYEFKHKNIILISILYKAKVLLSNMVGKFIVKKILGRSFLRIYSPYISTIITGLWDAWIFTATINRAKYQILIRLFVLELIRIKMDILEKNIKLILYRYYYFGEYNNNFDFLLDNLYKKNKFFYEKNSFLNIERKNTKLLALLFSFKESNFYILKKKL